MIPADLVLAISQSSSASSHTPIEPPPVYSKACSTLDLDISLSSQVDRFAFLSTYQAVFLIDDYISGFGDLWKRLAVARKSISSIYTAHSTARFDIHLVSCLLRRLVYVFPSTITYFSSNSALTTSYRRF